ncbi:hypothetical protein Sjap_003310 [Stephania japonica]|uniref:Uncharacterized protein n=1 Tax=Stephania japonica TaxID=461633 RepID=A0AAP0PUY1_9MAGN
MKPRPVDSPNRRSKESSLAKQSDSIGSLGRKPNKIAGKSSNGSVPEDFELETKDSLVSSPESEILDLDQSIGRKPNKIVEKSWNGSDFEVFQLERKDSVNSSPESEVLDFDQSVDLPEMCELFSSSTLLDSIEALSSKIGDEDKQAECDEGVVDLNHLGGMDDEEARIVVDFLRKAQVQVKNDSEVGPRPKKILDSLLQIMIEDLLPSGVDRSYSELVWAKMRIGFICFFFWIVMISFFFFNSAADTSFLDLPPT